MYCVVWRHYKATGISPYIISKYPDEEDAKRQPELAKLVKKYSSLRPIGTQKSMGGKENAKLGVFYKEQIANGNVVTQKTIDLDYNTIEDILVFKDKQASDFYLEFLSEIDWTSGDHEIVVQKEISSLKELSAFQ